MAILYSYPTNTNILPTDIILGTSTVIVGGRPKNQTKSLKILDLTAYFASVLVPPGSYVPYTGAIGSVNLGVYNLTANSIIKAGGTNLQFLMADGSVSTAPSLAGFVPYVGATQAVDLGTQNLYTTGQISTTDFVAANDIYVSALGGDSIRVGRGPGSVNGKSLVFGNLALDNNTTGADNVAIGWQALLDNTTGANNVAVGIYALEKNIGGGSNVAIGIQSLASNLAGNRNLAIGEGTLSFNTASNNTAIGYNSLLNNTTGSANLAIGVSALLNNTTASNNVAIGGDSLKTNITGFNNIALGNNTLNLNVGGANNIAIGVDSLKTNTTGLRNTAIGTSALFASTTANDNVAIGSEALQSNTASFTVGVGYQSLQNNTGVSNTGIGNNALKANTTGGSNTAVGWNALISNTTGNGNTVVGRGTGSLITTGSSNIGFGSTALFLCTTGSDNVAIGSNAIGGGNSVSGNVGVGNSAGRDSSAAFLVTVTNSVFIGNETKALSDSQTNQIVIGYQAIGAGSNTATLGNTSITTTRLRGAVQGGSFVKDSGTSSQYLMADGSVTTVPYKYNFSGSLTLTGTLTTTNLLTITIPANSLSNYLDLRSLMVQQSGPALAGFQIRVWHNSVNDFNTATRIANYSFGAGGADLYAQMTRKFSIQSGTLFGFSSTPSNATGEGSNSNAALSIAFNTTVINYLFVSIQLTNATDTATLRNVNITT